MKAWPSFLVLAIAIAHAIVVAQAGVSPDADPRIQKLIAEVSESRLQQLVTRLAGFGTRETMSAVGSARGIAAARQWILEELQRSSARLRVSFDSHRLAVQGRLTRPTELRNVIAVLPGRSSRRIYVSAHYDSLSLGTSQLDVVTTPGATNPLVRPDFDHDADAPGANDNGSGTALTMELARVLGESGLDFDATLVFALWAGEEQALLGSTAHAQSLDADGTMVEAVFNNDIVGNIRGGGGVDSGSVRVYALGPEDSMSRALARHIVRAGAIYVPSLRVRPMAREDRFGRGSDQSSFTQFGFPAVVFREARENFARQHSPDDTLDGVDFAYLAQNARANLAGAASLALAPPAPIVVDDRGQTLISRGPSGYDANLRWQAAPGAVGYRIYWRDTWSNDWQHQRAVDDVRQLVLPNLSIDDFVFGVAAIGAGGHESLVSAYVSPPRRLPELKVEPQPGMKNSIEPVDGPGPHALCACTRANERPSRAVKRKLV